MNDKSVEIELADDSTPYEMRELCEMCAVRAELVVEMVEAGILEPSGSAPAGWRFGVRSIIRLRKAQRLRRDLDINLSGIALALDLLDDLDQMRERAQALERQLQQLTDEA